MRRASMALVILAALASSRTATAATQIQLLFDWACDRTPAKDNMARDMAQAKCNLPIDDTGTEACQVVQGSPWDCYDKVTGHEDCWSPWDTSIEITTESSVLGWTVTGVVKAKASIRFSGDIDTCSASRNSAVNGQGGKYMSRSGNVVTSAIFELTAGGSVKFLSKKIFGVGGEKTCVGVVNQLAHETKTLSGCMES